jgi:hypothetical protein
MNGDYQRIILSTSDNLLLFRFAEQKIRTLSGGIKEPERSLLGSVVNYGVL